MYALWEYAYICRSFMWAHKGQRNAMPTLHFNKNNVPPTDNPLSSVFWILNTFPINEYIHCNMAKGLRKDICACEAACMHMYLGHPTDNVQIESLKKYDARKQSPTTVRLLLDQHKAACRHMWNYRIKPPCATLSVKLSIHFKVFPFTGCLIISCCTHSAGRWWWGADHRFTLQMNVHVYSCDSLSKKSTLFNLTKARFSRVCPLSAQWPISVWKARERQVLEDVR